MICDNNEIVCSICNLRDYAKIIKAFTTKLLIALERSLKCIAKHFKYENIECLPRKLFMHRNIYFLQIQMTDLQYTKRPNKISDKIIRIVKTLIHSIINKYIISLTTNILIVKVLGKYLNSTIKRSNTLISSSSHINFPIKMQIKNLCPSESTKPNHISRQNQKCKNISGL